MAKYVSGNYSLIITGVSLEETSTGTPYLNIRCDVVSVLKANGRIKDFEDPIGKTVYVKLWLSDKARKKSFDFIEAAGHAGSISDLSTDPEAINGFQFNASNKHDEYNGKIYDNFSAYPVREVNKVNTSKLMQLDAFFGVNSVKAQNKTIERINTQPINLGSPDNDPKFGLLDEDVPF